MPAHLEQLLCVGVLGEQVLAQNAPGWKLALADRAATLATIGCVLLAVLKQRASRLRHEVAPLTRKCAPLVCRLLVPPQVVLQGDEVETTRLRAHTSHSFQESF